MKKSLKLSLTLLLGAFFIGCSTNPNEGNGGSGDDGDGDAPVVTPPTEEDGDGNGDDVIDDGGNIKWLSEVIEFMPAPGQFVNSSTANIESAKRLEYTVTDGVVKKGNGIVSLGGFGGYIIFRFNHDVRNLNGCDFVILGNAFGDAQYPECSNSEPGIVEVSFDENGNGIPDDTWYELKSADRASEVLYEDYSITYYRPDDTSTIQDVRWSDNKGNSGVISTAEIAPFHSQCIYPLSEYFSDGIVPDEITFSGVRVKDNAANRGTADASYWVHTALSSGYVDNYSADYEAIVNNDEDTRGGNKFDISDAIDKAGNGVNLEKITFIRVYNAVHQQCGNTGETSPEIVGAISLDNGK